jgi:hypothetical protein
MFNRKTLSLLIIGVATSTSCLAFTHPAATKISASASSTTLNGLFDNWSAGGDGNSKESLDDQWQKQQEILKFRRSSTDNKQKYFAKVSSMQSFKFKEHLVQIPRII